MRTPARNWPLWLSAAGLYVLLLPLLNYSGDLYYREGGHSPDGPAMETYAFVQCSPVLFPLWMLLVWAYLAKYPGSVPLTAWRTKSPIAMLLSVVAIGASLFWMFAISRFRFWLPTRWPFTVCWLALVALFQSLRAAAIGRASQQ